jgi:conjugal transfer pilus assembly protein TraW
MVYRLALLSFMISTCYAKNLGVYGQTFEIKEKSLLEVIQQRLMALQDSGKLQLYQEKIQKRVEESIKRPKPVEGIRQAETYQSIIYDPTITVSQDLKDYQGNVFAHKGQKINPLDYQSFGKPLLFINGDEPSQVSWALRQEGKIVLVQGTPLDLEQNHRVTFYFDQGGALTKKFGINQVPVRVSQRDNQLLVERFEPNGN